MNDEYNIFLKWIEANDIELYSYQKEFLKALFYNEFIIMPRQFGTKLGIELLEKFHENNSKFN